MDVNDWVENRILWKARQHNLPAMRTYFFAELASQERGPLEVAVEQTSVGRPVLAFCDSASLWTVLGTEKIISRHDYRIRSFPLRQLKDVRPRDEPRSSSSLERVRAWRASLEYLSLEGKWWRQAEIWAPCGREAFALWNILLMFPGIYGYGPVNRPKC